MKRLHIFESAGKKEQQQKCHMRAAVTLQTYGRRSYKLGKCRCCAFSGAQVICSFPCKTKTIVAKKHLPKSVLFPLPLGPICTAKPRSFEMFSTAFACYVGLLSLSPSISLGIRQPSQADLQCLLLPKSIEVTHQGCHLGWCNHSCDILQQLQLLFPLRIVRHCVC